MSRIDVINPTSNDIDFIYECVLEFYSQNPYEIKIISNEKLKKAIKKLFNEKINYYFIIKYQGEYAGILQIMITGKNKAEIILIYLKKRYRHQGIGNYAMRYILKWLKEKNITYIKTEINIHNKISQKFFGSLGFQKHSLIYTKMLMSISDTKFGFI